MLVAVLVVAHSGEARGLESTQSIAVPSYFYPDSSTAGSLWDQMDAGAPAVTLAVINPASGPGDALNPDYAAQVERSQAAGLTVLGYVHTSYANTTAPDGSRTVEAVKADIDKFYDWYGVDGVFLDEASTDCEYATSYYKPLYDHVKSKGGSALVAINPGIQTGECYMSVSDIVVNFEGDHAKYAASYSAPAWVDEYPANRFWHLVYRSPDDTTMKSDMSLGKQRNAGRMYVTPDDLPNPWDTLPSPTYFDTEKQEAAGATPVADTTRPTITPVSPRPGTATRDRTPTVKARVTDGPNSLSKSDIKLYVAGRRVSPEKITYANGTLSHTSRRLSTGKKAIRVVATDTADNTTTKSWAFRIR